MPTLLLRISAPIQSWGHNSLFGERLTASEPTKSGIIGMLSNACGQERDFSNPFPKLEDLRLMKMGVRIDRPGVLYSDFQTAGGGKIGDVGYFVVCANGKEHPLYKNLRYKKFYIADGKFIVGLEHNDKNFLLRLNSELKNPKRPIFFGRKCCVPSAPIRLSAKDEECVVDGDLLSSLKAVPFTYDGNDKVRFVLEGKEGQAIMDDPCSFVEREFLPRYIVRKTFNISEINTIGMENFNEDIYV